MKCFATDRCYRELYITSLRINVKPRLYFSMTSCLYLYFALYVLHTTGIVLKTKHITGLPLYQNNYQTVIKATKLRTAVLLQQLPWSYLWLCFLLSI